VVSAMLGGDAALAAALSHRICRAALLGPESEQQLTEQQPSSDSHSSEAEAEAETEAGAETQAARWQPLPRVHVKDLPYERFLREFALPRQPFILEGASTGWAAAACWRDPLYFLQDGRANPNHKVSFTTSKAPFKPDEERVKRLSVAAALRRLRVPPPAEINEKEQQQQQQQQQQQHGEEESTEVPPPSPRYIKTWDYVRGGSGALQQDFEVPMLFDRAPARLSAEPVLGCSATDMKWLYIGEAGTGSGTHIDTNNSSAWLWVARGTKRWRCEPGVFILESVHID
jgi:hypothetical protein